MIQVFLIVILVVAQWWLTNRFEHQVLNAAEERAKGVADGVINGLNTLMVTKVGQDVISDKTARTLFIQKMSVSEKVKEMRVIRAKQLDSEFPSGVSQEQPIDDIDRQVLATGKPEFKLTLANDDDASLRTVVPFIASNNFRTTNCLKCHSVSEGAVLGAASITIDVKDDLASIRKINTLLWLAQVVMQLGLYFLLGHMVRHLSKLLGGEPAYVIDVIKQISKGNLSQKVVTQRSDDTSLLAAIKQMQDARKEAEDAVEERRVQLADIITFLPDATLAIDKEKRIIIWNNVIEEMTGIPAAQMIGKGDYAYTVPFYGEARPQLMDLVFLDSSELAARYPTISREGDSLTAEVFCQALYNNKGAWLFAKASPLHDRSGNVIGAIEIIRDITKLKRAEEKLKLAASVFTHAREAIAITDPDGTFIEVNDTFTLITGYSREEVLGQSPRILKSGCHDNEFYAAMWRSLIEKGYWQNEIWNRRKNGEVYIEMLTISAIRDAGGNTQHYVALFSDITERKKSEKLIWQQANFDSLTGLPNRRMVFDRLEQEIKVSNRDENPLALFFIDLDRFKEVNDSLGHDAGDTLLKDAARRMVSCVRESDTVGRLGGDEFVIILGNLEDISSVGRIASKLLLKLAEPFLLGKEMVYISASIGITIYPDDARDVVSLLKNADQAMYEAKRQGRDCFHFYTNAMQESADERMRMSNNLHAAIRDNQFLVYYQPIVELSTGAIHKAEALVRWQHPTLGLVSPADFIPAAEENGLINEIGDWVFRQAAAYAVHLHGTCHPKFQISVNKSPVQFARDPKAHVPWLEHLKQLGLPARSIVVEITESLLMEADIDTSNLLLNLRDQGMQVALDDFGTGYSSLAYLKKFDIDYLKIDQSFIRNLALDSPDFALCEAMVVMAHKLDLKVIAEGVETVQQRDLLEQIGCDYGQGYLFSRPVPAEEFGKLMANGKLPSMRGDGLQYSLYPCSPVDDDWIRESSII